MPDPEDIIGIPPAGLVVLVVLMLALLSCLPIVIACRLNPNPAPYPAALDEGLISIVPERKLNPNPISVKIIWFPGGRNKTVPEPIPLVIEFPADKRREDIRIKLPVETLIDITLINNNPGDPTLIGFSIYTIRWNAPDAYYFINGSVAEFETPRDAPTAVW